MPVELTCVQDTDYAEYFENVGKNTVFLLNENLAESAWNSEIYVGTSSYFDLPDDCWIITSKSILIGRWMEAYNNDDNLTVENILRTTVDWPDDIFVKFFAKNKIYILFNIIYIMRIYMYFYISNNELHRMWPRLSWPLVPLLLL